MLLYSISLHDYRNIADASVGFSPGVNLIYGINAQGKTNLLEAVYAFARGKSFRGCPEQDIMRRGTDGYRTEIEYDGHGRRQTLSMAYYSGVRTRTCNGIAIDRQLDLIGRFRAVLFCPEHLRIVTGGPAERRSYLDIAIAQCSRGYGRLLGDYKRILEHRNACLRTLQKSGAQSGNDELAVWTEKLARQSAEVCAERYGQIKELSPLVEKYSEEISGGREKTEICYTTDFPELCGRAAEDEKGRQELCDAYNGKFRDGALREIIYGASLWGAHRDDMKITVCGEDAKTFASQGQTRSAAIALKLAEGDITKKKTGEYPVFLLDDMQSELDGERRSYLFSKMRDRQIIITSCDPALPEAGDVKLIYAENGRFSETVKS